MGRRPHAVVHRPDGGNLPTLPPRAAGPRRHVRHRRPAEGRHVGRPRHQRLHDGRRTHRRRSDDDAHGHRTVRGRPRRRQAHATLGRQQGDLRPHPPGNGRKTLGRDHRRQADVDVGRSAARLRSGEEIPHAALLRGRPAERRLAGVELPLELRADGLTGLRRRGAQPPRRTLVRAGVARTDFGRLFGTEHPRLPLGHRRRGARTVVRPRPAGLRGRLLRRLFGLFPGRLPPEALQGLHRPLRHLQLRVDVRPDRGAVLHQPRLRRGLLGKG